MPKEEQKNETTEEETSIELDGHDTEAAAEGDTEGQGDGEPEGDDVVVTIGDQEPAADEVEHAQAPEWVRDLRKNHREAQKRIRELEAQVSAGSAESKPAALGPKPTLEGHDFDTEKYEAALAKWYDDKRAGDERAAKAETDAKSANEAWQGKLSAYGKAKTELKVKDFEDAEAAVQETLSSTQQGIILQGAENPALLVYALGKNPKKAKELAAITDPVKYAFAVAKLETQLKVTPRKAPPPERTVQGTGRVSGTVDSTLERLRSEAEKTGDYTKVTQYKSQKRKAA